MWSEGGMFITHSIEEELLILNKLSLALLIESHKMRINIKIAKIEVYLPREEKRFHKKKESG